MTVHMGEAERVKKVLVQEITQVMSEIVTVSGSCALHTSVLPSGRWGPE